MTYRTLVCVADLAQPLGPQQIFSFTEEKQIAIDLLVNNAGFGAYGEFHKVRLSGSSKWHRSMSPRLCT